MRWAVASAVVVAVAMEALAQVRYIDGVFVAPNGAAAPVGLIADAVCVT